MSKIVTPIFKLEYPNVLSAAIDLLFLLALLTGAIYMFRFTL